MNTRIYVTKKPAYRIESQSLFEELKTNFDLSGVTSLQLFNIYDQSVYPHDA